MKRGAEKLQWVGRGAHSAMFSVLKSLKNPARVARPKPTIVRGKLFILAEEFGIAWQYCKERKKEYQSGIAYTDYLS
jgi:hypothetical protein